MSKTPKFDKVLEQLTQVFQQGGILTGKIVKLKKNALSHPMLKDKPESFKQQIIVMMNDDLPLRAGTVNPQRPITAGIGGVETEGTNVMLVDVWQELNPGRWVNPVTLPLDVVEPLDGAEGMFGDSEHWHREDNTTLKPVSKDSNKPDDIVKKQTAADSKEKQLPTKDGGAIKPSARKESTEFDGDPLVEAYSQVKQG